ncbi:MAG: hypothetical protein ACI9VR_002207 [Cognaticolwellia sp.]
MYIKGFALQGVVGLPSFRVGDLERLARLRGSVSERCSVRMALGLALSAFDPQDAVRFFGEHGVGVQALESKTGLSDEFVFENPGRLRGIVDAESARVVSATLLLELDPPQFAMLRELAFKDPVLTEAFGPSLLTLELKVGWVFTRDLSVGSCAINGLRLGQLDVPTSSAAFKALRPLLRGMAHRGIVARSARDVSAQLLAADRSSDPIHRLAMEQIRAALVRAPFSLGTLQIVEEGEASWLALGKELVPVDAMGPGVWEVLALLCEVYLDPCEVLIIERPGLMLERAPQVERWLKGLLELAGGPLEQVLLLSRSQGHPIQSSETVAVPRSMTRFPQR